MKKLGIGAAIVGSLLLATQIPGLVSQPTQKPEVQESSSGDIYERTDDYSTERPYDETGDRDCADFDSQEEAQAFFEDEGGPTDDFHNLDRDGDGYVCETLY